VENFKQTKSQAELQVDKQNYYFFIFQNTNCSEEMNL